MLIKKVIINSSPLIVLFKSKQAYILPQLFDEILVPEAVWNEITKTTKNDAAAQQLPTVSWAQKVEGIIIAPEIAALRNAGLWLSDSIFKMLKQQAGE